MLVFDLAQTWGRCGQGTVRDPGASRRAAFFGRPVLRGGPSDLTVPGAGLCEYDVERHPPALAHPSMEAARDRRTRGRSEDDLLISTLRHPRRSAVPQRPSRCCRLAPRGERLPARSAHRHGADRLGVERTGSSHVGRTLVRTDSTVQPPSLTLDSSAALPTAFATGTNCKIRILLGADGSCPKRRYPAVHGSTMPWVGR